MAEPADPVSWRRSDAVLWRSLAGAGVVRSPVSAELVTLRSTANLVWLALEFPGSEAELCSDIASVVGEDRDDEVSLALAQLCELGAIIPA